MAKNRELIEQIGLEVKDALGTGPSETSRATQKQDLLSIISNKKPSPSPRVWVAIAAAAAVVLALSGVFIESRQQPLKFWIGDAKTVAKEGSWVQTSKDQTLMIRFEDNSRLKLAPMSATRIVTANQEEVQVDLSNGSLIAEIEGNGQRSWIVQAGPYQISVLGTVFSVHWDTASSVLEVPVEKGVVLVRGASLNEYGVKLSKGDHLRVDGKTGLISVESPPALLTSPSQKTSDNSAQSQIATNDAGMKKNGQESKKPDSTEGTTKKRKKHSQRPSWKEFYNKGDYLGSIDAARSAGLRKLLSQLSLEELWQLAEAARYARRSDVTTKTLITLRKRFSKSGRAKTAAFLLGRAAIELKHNATDAEKWFMTYLRENPKGPLAEEALGRLIDINHKQGQKANALRYAKSYLSQYSRGPFSELARSIINDQK